jgi:hypothetical protein
MKASFEYDDERVFIFISILESHRLANPFKTSTALRMLARRDKDEVRELCCLWKNYSQKTYCDIAPKINSQCEMNEEKFRNSY